MKIVIQKSRQRPVQVIVHGRKVVLQVGEEVEVDESTVDVLENARGIAFDHVADEEPEVVDEPKPDDDDDEGAPETQNEV